MKRLTRIMVIGASGSGKSTVAKALGGALDLPVVHGDRFYWLPGWVARERVEVKRLFDEAALADHWIIDGNNSESMMMRAERAHLIIYLHLNKYQRMWRVFLRSLRNFGQTRPDMGDGCPERFDREFLFNWVWKYDQRSKPKMDWFADHWVDKRSVLRLTNARDISRFTADPITALKHLGVLDGLDGCVATRQKRDP
ncbi:P-loop NTPase family protein [Aliiroseovarius halocynthiae]|uniref:AAA family ATPase n=1 Tax=Aliiroseovarius halocynthiae TaxID=985055 RepID=A0A545SYF8_9RHOB|nr:AAA family ATPase [Aliiroseovarius halocynthiae]TQV69998.1 AAA family ATPase [Aliiroseovarius halocynthiae]